MHETCELTMKKAALSTTRTVYWHLFKIQRNIQDMDDSVHSLSLYFVDHVAQMSLLWEMRNNQTRFRCQVIRLEKSSRKQYAALLNSFLLRSFKSILSNICTWYDLPAIWYRLGREKSNPTVWSRRNACNARFVDPNSSSVDFEVNADFASFAR